MVGKRANESVGILVFLFAVDLRGMTVYLAGLLSLILSQVPLVRKESYLPEGGPTSRNRIRADVTAQWNERDAGEILRGFAQSYFYEIWLNLNHFGEEKEKVGHLALAGILQMHISPGSPSAFALTKLGYCTHRDFSRRRYWRDCKGNDDEPSSSLGT